MTRRTFLFVSSLTACLSATAVMAADWPSFRGPQSTGVGENADLPAKWSKDHFLWKVNLPGPGASTPVIAGHKVFLTCYSGYGTDLSKSGSGFGKDFGGFGKATPGNAAEQKALRLHLLCFDAPTGKQLWQQTIEPKLPEAALNGFVRDHGYATSTPATDGQRVYVFFGKTGVLAFDLDGKKLWQADVGSGIHMYGTGSSLVLWKDLVIVNAGIESGSLLALDKATGKEVWRVKSIPANWTTPLLVEAKAPRKPEARANGDEQQELVLPLTGLVRGFDPGRGQELWRYGNAGSGSKPAGGKGDFGGFGNMAYSVVFATAVAQDGVVFVCDSGGPSQQMKTLAIRAGGRGDVTKTHLLWEQKKAGSQFNSPVVKGDFLYIVNNMVVCLRTDNGQIVYKERLSSPVEYPSPIIAGDKLIAPRRFDGIHVLATGEKFQRLGHNVLLEEKDAVINASPATSDGHLFIRTNAYLYCVGKKAVP